MLLQQLLRAIEGSDAHRSAAVTYAMLSLLTRLIASQSSVFNLWFSRRCYERSRGEMITMLYEKTLSRKITSTPTQPQEVVNPDRLKRPRCQLQSIWEGLYRAGNRFSTTDERPSESKQPASMGKILNMMRHAFLNLALCIAANTKSSNDVYEVAQR